MVAAPPADRPALARLWAHECLRVFSDRLISDEDRDWFAGQLEQQCATKLTLTAEAMYPAAAAAAADAGGSAQNAAAQARPRPAKWGERGGLRDAPSAPRGLGVGPWTMHLGGSAQLSSAPFSVTGSPPESGARARAQALRNTLYADFLGAADSRRYAEVADEARLLAVIEERLAEYNAQSKSRMDLVLFQYAAQHVCRISRVLRQPGGNALLVGVGGSGRASLTRVAAWLADFSVFSIEISKAYGVNEWRDDLRKARDPPTAAQPAVATPHCVTRRAAAAALPRPTALIVFTACVLPYHYAPTHAARCTPWRRRAGAAARGRRGAADCVPVRGHAAQAGVLPRGHQQHPGTDPPSPRDSLQLCAGAGGR